MSYDLTVTKLIEILTDIKEHGLGESMVVVCSEDDGSVMPVSGVKDSTVDISGKHDVLDDDGDGSPVVVIEFPSMVPMSWFRNSR